jgi:hypothetical protein
MKMAFRRVALLWIQAFGLPCVISAPHLSISQPQFAHVQPPQAACRNEVGVLICGADSPHFGQLTDFRFTPQRPLPLTVSRKRGTRKSPQTPNVINRIKSKLTESIRFQEKMPNLTLTVSRSALCESAARRSESERRAR